MHFLFKNFFAKKVFWKTLLQLIRKKNLLEIFITKFSEIKITKNSYFRKIILKKVRRLKVPAYKRPRLKVLICSSGFGLWFDVLCSFLIRTLHRHYMGLLVDCLSSYSNFHRHCMALMLAVREPRPVCWRDVTLLIGRISFETEKLLQWLARQHFTRLCLFEKIPKRAMYALLKKKYFLLYQNMLKLITINHLKNY